MFVDDYQRMSKASQLLSDLIARETLTIAGDRTACVQVYDSYPYAADLDEFMDAYEGAADEELAACHTCAAGAAAAVKLLADPAVESVAFHAAEDAAAGKIAVLEHDEPENEFVGVAAYVADAVAAQARHPPTWLLPCRMAFGAATSRKPCWEPRFPRSTLLTASLCAATFATTRAAFRPTC